MIAGWGLVDRLTQRWVRLTGRAVDLDVERWLDGPVGRPAQIAGSWLQDQLDRTSGTVVREPDQGLIPAMNVLDRDDFRVDDLAPEIVDFYEHTESWRLEVWSQWSWWALPGAWALMTVFARRLQQFSLPLRPLETSRGMSSSAIRVAASDGGPLGSAWQRTVRSTGETIYAGWYSTTNLPGQDGRSVRVAFPLPNGSLQVFLRPDVGPGRSLHLISGEGSFGSNGTYLVVNTSGRTATARRIPITEHFEVYVDDEDVLRTNHTLRLWNRTALQLHYRLDPAQPHPHPDSPAAEAGTSRG
jgi:hypothetical protein